jgi:hypothetical protein
MYAKKLLEMIGPPEKPITSPSLDMSLAAYLYVTNMITAAVTVTLKA